MDEQRLRDLLENLSSTNVSEVQRGLRALSLRPDAELSRKGVTPLVDVYLRSSPQCQELFQLWEEVSSSSGQSSSFKGHEAVIVSDVLNALASIILHTHHRSNNTNSKQGDEEEQDVYHQEDTRRLKWIGKTIVKFKLKKVSAFLSSTKDIKLLPSALKLLVAVAQLGGAITHELSYKVNINSPTILALADKYPRKPSGTSNKTEADKKEYDSFIPSKARFGSCRHRCMQLVVALLEHGDVTTKKRVLAVKGMAQALFKNLSTDPVELSSMFLHALHRSVLMDKAVGFKTKVHFFHPHTTLVQGVVPMCRSDAEEERALARTFLKQVLVFEETSIFPEHVLQVKALSASLEAAKQRAEWYLSTAKSTCLVVLNSLHALEDESQRELVLLILHKHPTLKARFLASSVSRLHLDPRPSFMWLRSLEYLHQLVLVEPGPLPEKVSALALVEEVSSMSSKVLDDAAEELIAQVMPPASALAKVTLSKGVLHTSSLVVVKTLEVALLFLRNIDSRLNKVQEMLHDAALASMLKQVVEAQVIQRMPNIAVILGLFVAKKPNTSWKLQEWAWVLVHASQTLFWYSKVLPETLPGAFDCAKVLTQLAELTSDPSEDVQKMLTMAQVSIIQSIPFHPLVLNRWATQANVDKLFETRARAFTLLGTSNASKLDQVDEIIADTLASALAAGTEGRALLVPFFAWVKAAKDIRATNLLASSLFAGKAAIPPDNQSSMVTLTVSGLQAAFDQLEKKTDQDERKVLFNALFDIVEHLVLFFESIDRVLANADLCQVLEAFPRGLELVVLGKCILGYQRDYVPPQQLGVPSIKKHALQDPLQLLKCLVLMGFREQHGAIFKGKPQKNPLGVALVNTSKSLSAASAHAFMPVLGRVVSTFVQAKPNQKAVEDIAFCLLVAENVAGRHPESLAPFFAQFPEPEVFATLDTVLLDRFAAVANLWALSPVTRNLDPKSSLFTQALLTFLQSSLGAQGSSTTINFARALLRCRLTLHRQISQGALSVPSDLASELFVHSESVCQNLGVVLVLSQPLGVDVLRGLLSLIREKDLSPVYSCLEHVCERLFSELDQHAHSLRLLVEDGTSKQALLGLIKRYESNKSPAILKVVSSFASFDQDIAHRLLEQFISALVGHSSLGDLNPVVTRFIPFLVSFANSPITLTSESIQTICNSIQGAESFGKCLACLPSLNLTRDQKRSVLRFLTSYPLPKEFCDQALDETVTRAFPLSFDRTQALHDFALTLAGKLSDERQLQRSLGKFFVGAAKQDQHADCSKETVELISGLAEQLIDEKQWESIFLALEKTFRKLSKMESLSVTTLRFTFTILNHAQFEPTSDALENLARSFTEMDTLQHLFALSREERDKGDVEPFLLVAKLWLFFSEAFPRACLPDSYLPILLSVYQGTMSEVDCTLRRILQIGEETCNWDPSAFGYMLGPKVLEEQVVSVAADVKPSSKVALTAAIDHFSWLTDIDFGKSFGQSFPLFRNMAPESHKPYSHAALQDLFLLRLPKPVMNPDSAVQPETPDVSEIATNELHKDMDESVGSSTSETDDSEEEEEEEEEVQDQASESESSSSDDEDEDDEEEEAMDIEEDGTQRANKSEEEQEKEALLSQVKVCDKALDPSFWFKVIEQYLSLFALVYDVPGDSKPQKEEDKRLENHANEMEEEIEDVVKAQVVFPAKKLIENGLVGFCIWGLSSRCKDVRLAAGGSLQAFGQIASRDALFREKMELLLVLKTIRGVFREPGLPFAPMLASFSSHALGILMKPGHAMYKLVVKGLLVSPWFDINDLPLFYKTFNSGSSNFKMERGWIMRVINDGIRTRQDLQLLSKRYVLNLLMSFSQSRELADPYMLNLVVEIMYNVATVCGDFGVRYLLKAGFAPWWTALLAGFSTSRPNGNTVVLFYHLLNKVGETFKRNRKPTRTAPEERPDEVVDTDVVLLAERVVTHSAQFLRGKTFLTPAQRTEVVHLLVSFLGNLARARSSLSCLELSFQSISDLQEFLGDPAEVSTLQGLDLVRVFISNRFVCAFDAQRWHNSLQWCLSFLLRLSPSELQDVEDVSVQFVKWLASCVEKQQSLLDVISQDKVEALHINLHTKELEPAFRILSKYPSKKSNNASKEESKVVGKRLRAPRTADRPLKKSRKA